MRHPILTLAVLPLLACSRPPVEEPTPEPSTPANPQKEPVSEASFQELTKGNTQLAFDLYQKLKDNKKGDNLFFSPASISLALAMTYAGAKGATAQEMEKTLHFLLPREELHSAFSSLLSQWSAPQKKYQLSIANRLWGQKGYGFLPDFLAVTKDQYNAALQDVEFQDSEKTRGIINKWVEEQTKEKIKDLLPPGSLTADTRLVLTNAIYFKGDWLSKFKEKETKPAPFFAPDGQKTVNMMHQNGTFQYARDGQDGVQILELPYVGKDLSMIVFLPEKTNGLSALEEKLTPEKVEGWLSRLRPESDVDVFLPKFTLESRFSLKEVFGALGMKGAFERGADFSGMNGGKEPLWIDEIYHKGFVEVSEAGTEAAAATAVVMTNDSVSMSPVFRADHPFVFMIRDNRSGDILFFGRLVRP